MKTRLNILTYSLLFWFLSSLPVQAAENCKDVLGSSEPPAYATSGVFRQADAERQSEIRKLFREWIAKARGVLHEPPKTPWKHIAREDLACDLAEMSATQQRPVTKLGLRNAKWLAVVTSAAGLWSRGAGQSKALVPFNLSELLSASESARLIHLGDIVKADTFEKVLRLAGPARDGESDRVAVARIRKETEAEFEHIKSGIRYSEKALTHWI